MKFVSWILISHLFFSLVRGNVKPNITSVSSQPDGNTSFICNADPNTIIQSITWYYTNGTIILVSPFSNTTWVNSTATYGVLKSKLTLSSDCSNHNISLKCCIQNICSESVLHTSPFDNCTNSTDSSGDDDFDSVTVLPMNRTREDQTDPNTIIVISVVIPVILIVVLVVSISIVVAIVVCYRKHKCDKQQITASETSP